MRCPRKLYVVVSRSFKGSFVPSMDTFTDRQEAERDAAERSRKHMAAYGSEGVTDWRVETFVKGD